MTELETLQRARMYMEKLANGINPIDDSVMPETETVNNVRLSRLPYRRLSSGSTI